MGTSFLWFAKRFRFFDEFGLPALPSRADALVASASQGTSFGEASLFPVLRSSECDGDDVSLTAVPEPMSVAAIGIGLAGLLIRKRRRREG